MIDRDEYYDCHESKEELLQGADDSYCEEECDDDEEARGYQMKLYAKCPYCGNQTEQLGVSFDAWNELVAQDTEKAELIEKLEARIEELISAKGIKELDARLAEAEREACAKTIELIIGVDVGWEDADTIRVAAKAIRTRGYQMKSLPFNTENAI